jgi:hypothetical protein
MPYCGNDLLLRLLKDLMWYSTLHWATLLKPLPILCIDKWYGWSADYTTTNVDVTVPAGATGTVSVPTTADTIDEVTKTLALLWTVSATGTIIDNNNAPTVATISCFGYWRKWCCIYFTLSNPSDQAITYTFVLTNGTAGSGLHDY